MDKKGENKIAPEKFREGNISLILDSYHDLFSDFDPRPYSIKALSDDFILECRKAAVVKKNKIELRFLIPKNRRNYQDEIKIKKRLKEYFHKHFKEEEAQISKIKREGIVWFILGALVMSTGPFLLNLHGFFYKLLMIMIEPAGWFFFWEGLGKFFIDSKKILPEYEFYKKMARSDIYFLDY